MYKQSVFRLFLNVFNKLMIRIVKPLTQVDLLQYSTGKEYFHLKRFPTWLATKKIDKIVLQTILATGVRLYKGKSLYSITSAYELNNALTLITNGIAKNDDFIRNQDGMALPSSVITSFKGDFLDNEWRQLRDHDMELQEKARAVSDNQDDFSSLMYSFTGYRYDQIRHSRLNKRIDNLVRDYNLNTYLNQNLYDIADLSLLFEAEDAIELLDMLHYYGISAFHNQSIYHLSLFTLQKLEAQYFKEDYTGITFDPDMRNNYLADRQKEKETEEQKDTAAEREKRNAAARERRARKKAEEQAAARKAAKARPNLKVIKTAAKPESKKKAAPVKKVQPKKKSSNRKAS